MPVAPKAINRLVGKTIVGFEQCWYPKEPTRSGCWGVRCVLLDDGSRVTFHVTEHDEADYSVELVRHPKRRARASHA